MAKTCQNRGQAPAEWYIAKLKRELEWRKHHEKMQRDYRAKMRAIRKEHDNK